MTASAQTNDVWREVETIHAKHNDNWRQARQGHVMRDGVWREFYRAVNEYSLVIARDTNNVNIRSLLNRESGFDANRPFTVEVVINRGVVVGAGSSTYALSTGSLGSNCQLCRIINNGTIAGKGGHSNGAAGTHAVYAISPVTIVNNSVISGGGGAGGRGKSISYSLTTDRGWPYHPSTVRGTAAGGNGGGGAGRNSGNNANLFLGGNGLEGNRYTYSYLGAYAGGLSSPPKLTATSNAPSGGRGGDLGQQGARGGRNGSAGGQPGKYAVGNRYITWQRRGDLRGGVS